MIKIKQWLPSIILMILIFIASSTPSTKMPDYGMMDMLVKKGGHMLGYGLLGILNMRGFKYDSKKIWLAWLLAVTYALSDEFHQSFVPGRTPSILDVFIFDGLGAAIGLLLMNYFMKHKEEK